MKFSGKNLLDIVVMFTIISLLLTLLNIKKLPLKFSLKIFDVSQKKLVTEMYSLHAKLSF